MKTNSKRIILISFVLIAFIAAFWYFTDIFIYMFVAVVLSVLGSPLVKLLTKLNIKGRHLPKSAAAALTLVVTISILSGFVYLLFPLVAYEIQQLSQINPDLITDNVSNMLLNIETFLHENELVNADFQLSGIITGQINQYLSAINVSTIFGNIIDVFFSTFIFVFSVIFMTYFSLKDNHIIWTMIKKMIPVSLRENFDNILGQTKNQLIRYFGGVLSEMVIVGTLEGLLCYFLGVPNALLIGVIGGFLNIIPYVGPLIAAFVAIFVGITSLLPSVPSQEMISIVIFKTIGTFVVVKLIDDFILQPVISGKSVNAHPLEMFIVILLAGRIGGVLGMMFAVPAYTVIRIIVKEFYSQYFIANAEEDVAEVPEKP
ncbi:MAG TPA: AI-2E family transporter [Bacteroidales bacterium]|nr:AI-2E family transporter [Bacteroidales bacterium]